MGNLQSELVEIEWAGRTAEVNRNYPESCKIVDVDWPWVAGKTAQRETLGEFPLIHRGRRPPACPQSIFVNLGGPLVCQQEVGTSNCKSRVLGARNSDYLIIPMKRVMTVEGRG